MDSHDAVTILWRRLCHTSVSFKSRSTAVSRISRCRIPGIRGGLIDYVPQQIFDHARDVWLHLWLRQISSSYFPCTFFVIRSLWNFTAGLLTALTSRSISTHYRYSMPHRLSFDSFTTTIQTTPLSNWINMSITSIAIWQYPSMRHMISFRSDKSVSWSNFFCRYGFLWCILGVYHHEQIGINQNDDH